MQRLVAALSVLVVVAGCGGGGEKTTTPPPPAAVASVEISQSTGTLKVGDILTLTAVAKGSNGQVLTGRVQTWTSSNSGIASVSQGAVTGLGPGTVTITVTVEGKTAAATITVELPGVASVAVSPQNGFVRVGSTLPLSVTLRDASGTALTGRVVTWSSSDESKATVSGAGVVTGVAPGTVTITATSEGKTGTTAVTVTLLAAPTITGITPATLVPGATATITGTGFSPTPAENTVTVGGTPVTVTAASETQLTVVLPAQMLCRRTGEAPIVVESAQRGVATRQHELQVAPRRTLAVGESLLLTAAVQASCNELSVTGGKYLVSVYSVSRTPSSRTDFELRGNTAAAASPVRVPAPLAMRTALGTLPPDLRDLLVRRADGLRAHRALLEQDRQLLRRLGRPAARRRLAASRSLSVNASVAATPPVPTTVGAVTTLRIRKSSDFSCTAYDTVRARVAYVGTKSIVLEDSAAPLARTMDADLVDLGQTFDNVIFDILTRNFGNPLAYDPATDQNGRILMLFTTKVNDRAAGLLGFVTLCDFLPAADFAASNQAEIFYARVPTSTTGTNRFDFNNPIGWRAFMKGTVAHEAKHIVSFAERMATPIETDGEEIWLEEGMAQVATELYARTVYNVQWKGNAGYAATVRCDIRCAGAQFLMADHFLELYDYFSDVEHLTYLTIEDVTVYGSAWLFARWLTDQYASDEGAFLRSITQEYTLFGLDNIENKTGRPYAELNGYFSLSLLADDYPGFTPPAGAKYIEPSWNMPDIFAGFATDLVGFVASPLVTHPVSFGDFSVAITGLRGGTSSFFVLSGTQTVPQLLDVRSSLGGPLDASSPLRVAILRVQ